ncbi:SDR family oxidoreductase [Bermanella sp. R86510]|uniref:SDR family oxidoreductase n=1 Tax=unclassified Bermanella TaxID=2627862 RepID=UPI0037C5B289
MTQKRYALITGGAHRIGAAIATRLHQAGYDILLHYGKSEEQAKALQHSLNTQRPQSCHIKSAALSLDSIAHIVDWVTEHTQQAHTGLDVLVNNASVFYPTPWQEASAHDWQDIMTLNAQVPFFLTQGLLSLLKQNHGCVINLIDIHAERGLEQHPIYSASKAALKMLTLSLAKDYGNEIRANGISPGAILWPGQDDISEQAKQSVLEKVPMQRLGDVDNIAQTALFLCENDYINGQIINIDGGRTTHS